MNYSNAVMERATRALLSYPLEPESPADFPEWYDDGSEDGTEEVIWRERIIL